MGQVRNMDPLDNIYPAYVNEVIDGDTFRVDISIGFDITIHGKIRLYGIDCPELGTPEGEKAKEFCKQFEKTHILIVRKWPLEDSFGRYLVEAFYLKDSRLISINDLLVENGLAKPYKRGHYQKFSVWGDLNGKYE